MNNPIKFVDLKGNTSNINFRGGVIDYENYVRKIIRLPRPFNLNHSKQSKN